MWGGVGRCGEMWGDAELGALEGRHTASASFLRRRYSCARLSRLVAWAPESLPNTLAVSSAALRDSSARSNSFRLNCSRAAWMCAFHTWSASMFSSGVLSRR